MDRHRTKQESHLVSMKLRDGREIWITIQVGEVSGPIMSVGKENDQCATFPTGGGVLWREEVLVDRVRNHYELECWIKPGNVLALVCVGGSSGKRAAPQRADAEILMHAQPQGAHAPRADEEHLELDIIQ